MNFVSRLFRRRCEYCHQKADDVKERSVSTGPGHGKLVHSCADCAASHSWETLMGMTQLEGCAFGRRVRWVGIPRVTDSRFGANAYGSVLSEDDLGQRIPVICGHGGSAWFCLACAERLIAEQSSQATA